MSYSRIFVGLIIAFFIGCSEKNVVEAPVSYELDISALTYINNATSSVDYRASIVDGVSPRVFLFVNDTWEIAPTAKHVRGSYEYGTIVYPTEKPPIPVLYAFWNNEYRYITIGLERR